MRGKGQRVKRRYGTRHLIAWSTISAILGIVLAVLTFVAGWLKTHDEDQKMEALQTEQIHALQDRMDRAESRINWIYEHPKGR